MREKKNEEEEENEEITSSKALEMADKLKMYCLRKAIPDVHCQVSEIEDKTMNFTMKNPKQPSVSYFYKLLSPSQ